MYKTIIYNFTDECGAYTSAPKPGHLNSHPFYVRSNLIIELSDYLKLEKKVFELKEKYSVPYSVEVKWAHYRDRLKHRKNIPHNLTAEEIHSFISEIVEYTCNETTAKLYFTFTDNKSVGKINEIKLISMHLQNAIQRAQTEAISKEGYAIVISDDMNASNKKLKMAFQQLTVYGDKFTEYTNVQKGLLVDYSDMSSGLQIADFFAGLFTATLKYFTCPENEKRYYDYSYDIFVNLFYKVIRYTHFPNPEVYTSGIKEIPSGSGKEIAVKASKILEDKIFCEEVELYLH